MTDFKVESIGGGDYDLVLTDGDFVLIGDTEDTWLEAVGQDLLYTFGVWYGESVFDRNAGFPWRETVFGTNPIEGISALIVEYAQARPDIEGFDEPPVIEYDAATARLFLTLQAVARGFVVPVALEVANQ